MPLNIGYDASGLDGKLRMVLDSLIASLQTWVGGQEGINAAQRLNELEQLPTVKTGSGCIWFTDTAPTGYLICDGSAVSRATYAALFNTPGWGTTFGAGDGSTTFNLPDLRQRIPMGKAASGTGSTLGGTFGSIDHTHTGGTVSGSTANESAHTHTIASGATGNPSAFTGITLGTDADVAAYPHTHGGGTLTTSGGSAHLHGAGTLAVGASGSANPPIFVVNWIVKT